MKYWLYICTEECAREWLDDFKGEVSIRSWYAYDSYEDIRHVFIIRNNFIEERLAGLKYDKVFIEDGWKPSPSTIVAVRKGMSPCCSRIDTIYRRKSSEHSVPTDTREMKEKTSRRTTQLLLLLPRPNRQF